MHFLSFWRGQVSLLTFAGHLDFAGWWMPLSSLWQGPCGRLLPPPFPTPGRSSVAPLQCNWFEQQSCASYKTGLPGKLGPHSQIPQATRAGISVVHSLPSRWTLPPTPPCQKVPSRPIHVSTPKRFRNQICLKKEKKNLFSNSKPIQQINSRADY